MYMPLMYGSWILYQTCRCNYISLVYKYIKRQIMWKKIKMHQRVGSGYTRLHDDVMTWKHFPHCWPFVRGICHLWIPLTKRSQIARFMGPTWGPPGSCQPQMGPMLAPWTLLLGTIMHSCSFPLAINLSKQIVEQTVEVLPDWRCHDAHVTSLLCLFYDIITDWTAIPTVITMNHNLNSQKILTCANLSKSTQTSASGLGCFQCEILDFHQQQERYIFHEHSW